MSHHLENRIVKILLKNDKNKVGKHIDTFLNVSYIKKHK